MGPSPASFPPVAAPTDGRDFGDSLRRDAPMRMPYGAPSYEAASPPRRRHIEIHNRGRIGWFDGWRSIANVV